MIEQGIKTEEYRTLSPWILTRLIGKSYDLVQFKNGYGDVPTIHLDYCGYRIGLGNPEWGASSYRLAAIIELGSIVELNDSAAILHTRCSATD